jgi:hypothetical protein
MKCTRARHEDDLGAAHAQSHPLKRDDRSTWVGPIPKEFHLQVKPEIHRVDPEFGSTLRLV